MNLWKTGIISISTNPQVINYTIHVLNFSFPKRSIVFIYPLIEMSEGLEFYLDCRLIEMSEGIEFY